MERIGRTSRNIPSGKAPKSLKTVKWSTPIHFVISRSCVRVTPPAPKSIENFGFRCFFVEKMLKMVWVKMRVNCLTHTLTHIGWQSAALPPTASSCPMGTTKCAERTKEHRRGNCFLSGALLACGTYRICAMKLPIFSAAFCCICRVTWV